MGSYANQQKVINSMTEDYAVNIGSGIIPALKSFQYDLIESREYLDLLTKDIGEFIGKSILAFKLAAEYLASYGLKFKELEMKILRTAGNLSFKLGKLLGNRKMMKESAKMFEQTIMESGRYAIALDKINAKISRDRKIWADYDKQIENESAEHGKKKIEEVSEVAKKANAERGQLARERSEFEKSVSEMTAKYVEYNAKAGADATQILKIQQSKEISDLQNAYDKKLISEKVFQKARENINKEYSQKIKDQQKNDLTEMFGYINQGIGQVTNILSSVGSLMSALNKQRIAEVDAEMQAELAKAGVLELTQVEQAKKEYDAAVATGDALDIEEKRRALAKAKIEEKYLKKKAKLEYDGAIATWKIQKALAAAQVPLAILNAISAGWKFGPIGAAAYGAAAAIASGIQYAAVSAAKPVKPATAQTGLSNYTVPDMSAYKNDRAPVMASPGEEVNITPRGENAGGKTEYNFFIGKDVLYRFVQQGINTGAINVSDRNIGRGVFAT